MRVVCLSTSYPRFDGDPGGHFVEAQLQQLQRGGDLVEVIAPGRASAVEVRNGTTIHWVGGTKAFGNPGVVARLRSQPLASVGDMSATAIRFARVCNAHLGKRATPPDRVVAHWLIPSVWPALSHVAYRGPVDAYAHGGDVRLLLRMPWPLRQRVLLAIAARATTLTFASHSLAAALLEGTRQAALARQLERIATVAPPPFELPVELHDPQRRAQLRRSWRSTLGVPDDATIAVAVSRLVGPKRVDLAIDAVGHVANSHLIVVGDGPMRASLQARARHLGARAHFTGFLARQEALAALAAADVLLHPSAVEAAPTVVREARALGIPVIACGAGDVVRWSNADPEIRCVPLDAEAISTELRRIGVASTPGA